MVAGEREGGDQKGRKVENTAREQLATSTPKGTQGVKKGDRPGSKGRCPCAKKARRSQFHHGRRNSVLKKMTTLHRKRPEKVDEIRGAEDRQSREQSLQVLCYKSSCAGESQNWCKIALTTLQTEEHRLVTRGENLTSDPRLQGTQASKVNVKSKTKCLIKEEAKVLADGALEKAQIKPRSVERHRHLSIQGGTENVTSIGQKAGQ